ncbi:hypothetical protein [Streptomyces sp. NPDC086182]|jgi:hypothetical protein|uniref:hypothetical protein n=1 Tax=Streptomyces sp. NPDC086182 TaxID=3155058 RepID=UPI003417171B
MTALEDHGAECGPDELGRLGTVAVDLATACLAQHLDTEDQLPAEVRTQALARSPRPPRERRRRPLGLQRSGGLQPFLP